VGVVDLGDVGGRRYIAVGVHADAHQHGQVNPVAAHVAHDVADDVGGGDHPQLLPWFHVDRLERGRVRELPRLSAAAQEGQQ